VLPNQNTRTARYFTCAIKQECGSTFKLTWETADSAKQLNTSSHSGYDLCCWMCCACSLQSTMMPTWAERLCCPSVAKQRDLHTQTDIMTTHVLLHDVLPGPALCSFGCAPLLWLTLFSLPSALVCATVQQSPNAFVKNSKQSEDN